EQGLSGILSGVKYFSVNFLWIATKEEVEPVKLDSKALKLCEDVAEWLSRDINELGWPYEGALDYSKKLIRRIGFDEVKHLWDEFANGAYPNVKRFLMEAKQISNLEEPIDTNYLIK
ncbi:MAG: hypothetical protein AABY22_10640, partial [Nanoarchaeota archaeon]